MAKEVVYIVVTAKDIENGVREVPSKCPIALAASRQLGTAVMGARILEDRTKVRFARVPDRVRDWIIRFDRGDRVQPIRFKVEMDKWAKVW